MIRRFGIPIILIMAYIVSCVVVSSSPAFAACSPGIPCTDYTITANTDAATNASFNALKSGVDSPYTETACDANFMNQIYSQAFIHGQREVMMSQQIIHKPDSVLEYVCFDQMVRLTADQAGPIFTETTDWTNREVELWTAGTTSSTVGDGNLGAGSVATITLNHSFPSGYLDGMLQELVFEVVNPYISNSFSATYLGGHTNIDNTLESNISSVSVYNCSHMSTVWNVAKCMNFGEDDKFLTFNHLVTRDPRALPASCSPSMPAPPTTEPEQDPCPAAGGVTSNSNTAISNDLIRTANNCDNGSDLNDFVEFDEMKTYFEMIKGVERDYIAGVGNDTGELTACSPPLPTGVAVYTYTYDEDYNVAKSNARLSTSWGRVPFIDRPSFVHYEHICPNPGCYYSVTPQPYTLGDPLPAYFAGQCEHY